MAINTTPFHPVTGQLRPGHREAYLRGDLSGKNTDLVDAYFKANPSQGSEAFQRFHELQQQGHQVRPVGWVQHQFHLIRTEPARFRQRASLFLLGAVLVSGAVFAASSPGVLPKTGMIDRVAVSTLAAGELAPAAGLATAELATVSGRILDENGHPLVGATVLDRRSGRGVSTDAAGRYSLPVAKSQGTQLQFGYGGYQEEEMQVKGRSTQNVTLLPRTDKPARRHWWSLKG